MSTLEIKDFNDLLEEAQATPTLAEPKQDESAPQKHKLKVLLPIGLPGMGKSVFEETLKNYCDGKENNLTVLSTDVIRQ